MADDAWPYCHAGRDGDCIWKECPQIKDNEPETTGRHCPRDVKAMKDGLYDEV